MEYSLPIPVLNVQYSLLLVVLELAPCLVATYTSAFVSNE